MRPRDSIDLLRARRERIVAKKGARREKRKRNWVKEYGEALLIAGVLFVFLRGFVVQAFQIPSGSMEDTLLIGDFLVANKFLYGARVPWTDYRLPAVRQPERGTSSSSVLPMWTKTSSNGASRWKGTRCSCRTTSFT
jgi:hypothetical protein